MLRCFFNDIISEMLVELTQFVTKLAFFACKPHINLLIEDKVY